MKKTIAWAIVRKDGQGIARFGNKISSKYMVLLHTRKEAREDLQRYYGSDHYYVIKVTIEEVANERP